MPDIQQYATPYYTSVEFTVATGQTNNDVLSNNATFDDQFGAGLFHGYANKMILRTDQTITVRMNSISNHVITIASTDSPFTFSGVDIQNVYITNTSGNTANIKILLSKVSV